MPQPGVDEGEDYLLGTRDEELARLAFQHRVWSGEAAALWERAGFGPGQTLLDLGCGPGFATLDLAHWVGPEGRVLAVDRSRRFLDHLAQQAAHQGLDNIVRQEAEADELDLPARSLDGAYARWLFCFLERPQEVIERVAPALRPGAPFAVTDYFNYRAFTVAPRSDAFDAVIAQVAAAFADGGGLEIQGRMPGLLRRGGLRVRSIETSSRIARPGSALWHWPETFFAVFLPKLVDDGRVSTQLADRFRSDWADRSSDPDAFLCLPPMFDIVAVRPG